MRSSSSKFSPAISSPIFVLHHLEQDRVTEDSNPVDTAVDEAAAAATEEGTIMVGEGETSDEAMTSNEEEEMRVRWMKDSGK